MAKRETRRPKEGPAWASWDIINGKLKMKRWRRCNGSRSSTRKKREEHHVIYYIHDVDVVAEVVWLEFHSSRSISKKSLERLIK
jgi:hypothetical protein